MANAQRLVCRIRIQLAAVAAAGTSDLWADTCAFLTSMGITRIRGKLVLCEKFGNFRVRVGIQTFTTDPEAPATATSITTGTGVAYVSTTGKNFVDFDPTVSGNGVINTNSGFRIGLLYSSTDATVSRGDVILELYADA